MPAVEGRENFLDRADRNFTLFGPANARAEASSGVPIEIEYTWLPREAIRLIEWRQSTIPYRLLFDETRFHLMKVWNPGLLGSRDL